MAHANPLPVSSMPSESCEAISPYPFKPYSLTPLDATSPSPHHFASLLFSLSPNHLPHALNRLEGAILRLIAHYPFLTGNVASSSLPSSDDSSPNESHNAFEIQPVTASLMQHSPMLQTQHHPATSSFPPFGHPQGFLPFPECSLPTGPSPALRCKANALGDKLVLVFGWDTRVMDPGAVFTVARALAEFCRDPMAAREELPVADPWSEAQGRGTRACDDVFNCLGLPSAGQNCRWSAGTRNRVGPTPTEQVSSMPETRTARLNGDKIAMLTDACNLLVWRVAGDALPGRLHEEDVVSAVLGVTGSRAREHRKDSYSESATDLRHLSPLPNSTPYMGHATVSIPVSVRPNSLPALNDSQMRSILPEISPQDLYRICNVAVCLRGWIGAASEKGRELNTTSNVDGKSGMGNGMKINSLRPLDFYMDFGPLGRVRDVNAPGARENGTCWILPDQEAGGCDVAVTVEQSAMEKLSTDRLVTWVVVGGF
ncbi:acetyl-coenzyme A synthetase 2 [Aspergillus melleus]|uniref:Acetyl-coenzyme A synthetase 2 n=1 Tax=Aspergillus melleus TaxID=138277 RepID=A0ACC3B0M3_9EURO|nr:acetyl-coenzyme A synthetase 2 [Aspergillus melleus]